MGVVGGQSDGSPSSWGGMARWVAVTSEVMVGGRELSIANGEAVGVSVGVEVKVGEWSIVNCELLIVNGVVADAFVGIAGNTVPGAVGVAMGTLVGMRTMRVEMDEGVGSGGWGRGQ